MEIELRAKITDINQIKEKLSALGATFVKTKEIKDYYFGDLGLYKKNDHSFWIRIRVQGEEIELAYKGPTETDGVYEEYEQKLQNLETSLTLFQKMGLDNPINIEKKRDYYKLRNINILIDQYETQGTFIELEIISENEDKFELYQLMKELGIKKENIFEKGYITQFLKEQNSPFSKWIKN